MKFRVVKGYNGAKVNFGSGKAVIEAGEEFSTWDFDAIAALNSNPALEVVDESASSVIAQIPELSDRQLRAVLTFDDRPSVHAAVHAARAGEPAEAPAYDEEDDD